MFLAQRVAGILFLTFMVILTGCSQLPGAPAPASTATPRQTHSPAPVVSPTTMPSPGPIIYRPSPTPSPVPASTFPATTGTGLVPTNIPLDPDAVAVERRCFYPDTSIPDDLMQPLADVVDEHTTRTIVTEGDAFRVEVGYFVPFYRGPRDDAHKPIPTPISTAWDPDLMNHPFLTHDPVYLPPGSHLVVRNEDSWKFTLYGLMAVHPYHGHGLWALRAEATMNPDTCESELERVLAGPDEVVLYPED